VSTLLDQVRQEAKEHRDNFLRLHKDACLAMGKYCEAIDRLQALTHTMFQPGLGGNPENENAIRKLLIVEPPVRVLQRNGCVLTDGYGWNLSADVVPLIERYPE